MANKNFANLERMNIPLDNIIAPKKVPTEPQAEPSTENESPTPQKVGSKYVAAVNPYEGPRTRRVQLLMRPGLYTGLKHIATRKKQSINNLIECILIEYVDQERQAEEKGKD